MIACPLCHSTGVTPGIERPHVPVFQNVRHESPASARAAAVGRLSIRHCDACGFVFNATFDPALAVYAPGYENDQTVSDAFRAHLDTVAGRVLRRLPPAGTPIVLEVGCGQGHFLQRLAQAPGSESARFIGFDPAWRGGETDARLTVLRGVFDAAAIARVKGPVGAVVSRHVIEHIPDPVGFLRRIGEAMAAAEAGALMIETPCLDWILRHEVVFDFFYEHCSYFTAATLRFALEAAGFAVHGVEALFAGQYLWAEAEHRGAPAAAPPVPAPAGHAAGLARLQALTEQRIAAVRARLAGWRSRGGVALWGAGAKGATLATLADPDAALLDALIDINPRKQGGWLAMTAHPILAPHEAARRGVRTVMLLNPNYHDEVARMIRDDALPFQLEPAP